MYLSSANKGFCEKYLLISMMNFRNEPMTIKLLGKHVDKVLGTVVTYRQRRLNNFSLIPVTVAVS